MDTTLRFKAMEKESLTSKFLFNIDVIYLWYLFNICWFLFNACVKRFRSQPFFTSFHDTFADVFGGGGGGITIELGNWEVFSAHSKKGYALSFNDTGLRWPRSKVLIYAKITSPSI